MTHEIRYAKADVKVYRTHAGVAHMPEYADRRPPYGHIGLVLKRN
jgi:hypothetical protein